MDKKRFIFAIMAIALLFGAVWYYQKTEKATTKVEEKNQEETKQTGGLEITDITDIVVGTGQAAKAGDAISVHYEGMLQNGTIFDSSYERGEPLSLTLGAHEVIEGWEKGLVGMKAGGKRKLIIPPELAYGNEEAGGGIIPAGSTLIFEIELIGISL